jgi:hypothetical protein
LSDQQHFAALAHDDERFAGGRRVAVRQRRDRVVAGAHAGRLRALIVDQLAAPAVDPADLHPPPALQRVVGVDLLLDHVGARPEADRTARAADRSASRALISMLRAMPLTPAAASFASG